MSASVGGANDSIDVSGIKWIDDGIDDKGLLGEQNASEFADLKITEHCVD